MSFSQVPKKVLISQLIIEKKKRKLAHGAARDCSLAIDTDSSVGTFAVNI